jgi:hypothetical protein
MTTQIPTIQYAIWQALRSAACAKTAHELQLIVGGGYPDAALSYMLKKGYVTRVLIKGRSNRLYAYSATDLAPPNTAGRKSKLGRKSSRLDQLIKTPKILEVNTEAATVKSEGEQGALF